MVVVNFVKNQLPPINGMLDNIQLHKEAKKWEFGRYITVKKCVLGQHIEVKEWEPAKTLFKQPDDFKPDDVKVPKVPRMLFTKGMSDERQVEIAKKLSKTYARLALESGNVSSFQAKLELLDTAFQKESNNGFCALIELEDRLPERVKKNGRIMSSLVGFWASGIIKGVATDKLGEFAVFLAQFCPRFLFEKDSEVFAGFAKSMGREFLRKPETFTGLGSTKVAMSFSFTIYSNHYPKSPEDAEQSALKFLRSYQWVAKGRD